VFHYLPGRKREERGAPFTRRSGGAQLHVLQPMQGKKRGKGKKKEERKIYNICEGEGGKGGGRSTDLLQTSAPRPLFSSGEKKG